MFSKMISTIEKIIREFLIQTFPSEEAFKYIMDGRSLFIRDLAMSLAGSERNLKRMEKDLRAVWCYDNCYDDLMEWKSEQEMAEIKRTYFAKWMMRTTNQNLKRLAETHM